VKGVPLKIRIRTNQKSELMAAWNEDATHVTSEFRFPASTHDMIRLKKSKFTIHLISGNRGVPSDCLSAFIMEIVKRRMVEAFPVSQGNVRQASQ
jgi:hypothetical protein